MNKKYGLLIKITKMNKLQICWLKQMGKIHMINITNEKINSIVNSEDNRQHATKNNFKSKYFITHMIWKTFWNVWKTRSVSQMSETVSPCPVKRWTQTQEMQLRGDLNDLTRSGAGGLAHAVQVLTSI